MLSRERNLASLKSCPSCKENCNFCIIKGTRFGALQLVGLHVSEKKFATVLPSNVGLSKLDLGQSQKGMEFSNTTKKSHKSFYSCYFA